MTVWRAQGKLDKRIQLGGLLLLNAELTDISVLLELLARMLRNLLARSPDIFTIQPMNSGHNPPHLGQLATNLCGQCLGEQTLNGESHRDGYGGTPQIRQGILRGPPNDSYPE